MEKKINSISLPLPSPSVNVVTLLRNAEYIHIPQYCKGNEGPVSLVQVL